MNIFTRMIVATFALASGVALAGIIPSAAHETTSKSVTLPEQIGGDAIWVPCASCSSMRLATNDRTEFRLGDVRVSLAAMRLELKNRPNELILLRNSPDDRVLVAHVLSAQ